MLLFIASFVLTTIAAFIQTTNWILIGNLTKPNLILVTLLILALVNHGWLPRAFLILSAALILKFTPSLAVFDFIFIGAALSSILFMDLLRWRQPLNLFAAILVGTIIISLEDLIFLPLVYELILNLLLGLILFSLLKLVYGSKIKLQGSKF